MAQCPFWPLSLPRGASPRSGAERMSRCHRRSPKGKKAYRKYERARQRSPEGMAILRASRNTPKGIATRMWLNINNRCRISRDPKHPLHTRYRTYANVLIKLTREEFVTWAVPAITEWLDQHPNARPYLDRRNSLGHYELSNIRVVDCKTSNQNKRTVRYLAAPPGMAWCSVHKE